MELLNRHFGYAIVACALAAAAPARAASLEYIVKANFLLKFVPFVRWPGGALPPGAPFVLCIAAADPFDGALQLLANGRRIDDRLLVVRKGTTGCNMIFAQAPPAETQALLAGTEGQPVLTVTDNDSGDAGIIRFRLQNGRVRFEVDTARAARAQLGISSRLLEAALAVRGEDGR